MIKKAFLSVSIVSTILLAGCDNTAKIPETKDSVSESSATKPSRLATVIGRVLLHGKWQLKKVG